MNLEQIRNTMIEIVENMKPEHRALVEQDVREGKIEWSESRFLGRCSTHREWSNSKQQMEVTLIKFEFNKLYFKATKSEEYMKDVICHELMHLLTNKEHKTFCKHDKRFKANCKLYGCNGMAKATKESCEDYFEAMNSSKLIYCTECGCVHEKVGKMTKKEMDRIIKTGRTCPECGGTHVDIIDRY